MKSQFQKQCSRSSETNFFFLIGLSCLDAVFFPAKAYVNKIKQRYENALTEIDYLASSWNLPFTLEEIFEMCHLQIKTCYNTGYKYSALPNS